MQLLLLCQSEINVCMQQFLLRQEFSALKNEELCELSRLFGEGVHPH